MKFEIKHHWSGAVVFTAEIECADDAPASIKLGLAVRVAVKSGAYLSGANLSGANLSGAYLSGANLSWAYLIGADLSGANLIGANLSGANLSGANLSGAYLIGAYLSGANLIGADLSGADLSGANLIGANLIGANLSGANLIGADLSGANLSGANLIGEKIKRILASVQRISDGYTFNLFDMEIGPPKIVAGCRFMTIDAYAAHVAAEYPDTPKARETLRILDYFGEVVAAEVKQVEVAS
jgi:hypothetical protein